MGGLGEVEKRLLDGCASVPKGIVCYRDVDCLLQIWLAELARKGVGGSAAIRDTGVSVVRYAAIASRPKEAVLGLSGVTKSGNAWGSQVTKE